MAWLPDLLVVEAGVVRLDPSVADGANTCDAMGFCSLWWVLGFRGGEIIRLLSSVSH